MKKFALTIAIVALVSVSAFAEWYKLTGVKRVEQNLYKTDDGIYIVTKYCYEYTYGEDVIYNDDNKEIIFKNGTKCTVDKLMK